MPPKIAVVMGTRPEAIKMAPVVKALKKQDGIFETVVIATAQHRDMLDQVLSVMDIRPDLDLDLMRSNQSLADLTARVVKEMDGTLADLRPDLLLIQGDTTTVFASALAAFYRGIPVAHVEAGLRSYDICNPFPEEINRRLATQLAQIHLAPTSQARENLLREDIPREKIVVTGNTVIDAIQGLLDAPFTLEGTPLEGMPLAGRRLLVVTSHRRESFGEGLHNTCIALKELVRRFPDLAVVYPVHMNPAVRETVMSTLGGAEGIYLTEPLDYLTFINLMKRAHLILTDSGGVQEEAPTLGKPLLVLRKVTERPEAFRAGMAKVVGTEADAIVRAVTELLTDRQAYDDMVSGENPYGDGLASERIVKVIDRWLGGRMPLLEADREFSPSVSKRR